MKIEHRSITTPPRDHTPAPKIAQVQPPKPKKPKRRDRGKEYAESWRLSAYSMEPV